MNNSNKKVGDQAYLSMVVLYDTVAYYNSSLTDKTKVTYLPFDTFQIKSLVGDQKKQFGDSLVVFLKLTSSAGIAQRFASLLNLIKSMNVEVALWNLTTADLEYFQKDDFTWEPAEPLKFTSESPESVELEVKSPVFFVRLNNDNTVWFHTITSSSDTIFEKVNEPIKESLKKSITLYGEGCTRDQQPPSYFIQGDRDIRYKQFKSVLQAFKENEIFNFELVNSETNLATALKPKKESTTLDLFMPKDEDQSKHKVSPSTLTLLLLKNDLILAYKGDDITEAKTYDYWQIRRVITDESKKSGDKFFVLIKGSGEETYKNTVAILDEMAICNILRYAMEDATALEKEIIKKTFESL